MSVGTNISEDSFQHLDEFEPQTTEAVVKEKGILSVRWV